MVTYDQSFFFFFVFGGGAKVGERANGRGEEGPHDHKLLIEFHQQAKIKNMTHMDQGNALCLCGNWNKCHRARVP